MREQPIASKLLGDVLWRRLDQAGMEHCRVAQVADFYSVNGCVLTIVDGRPFRTDYLVQCDRHWNTAAAYVQTLQGSVHRKIELRRDEAGIWRRDGELARDVEGIVDIDLAISPATNTLPIRRLKPEIGSAVSVDAVWVQFPSLSVDRLSQSYTRTGELGYRYESGGGSFTADLEVDEEGIVVRYGDLWERIAP